jgi:hypothetical protein
MVEHKRLRRGIEGGRIDSLPGDKADEQAFFRGIYYFS